MVEPAKKQPLTEERVKTQLEKTGETPFYFKELDVCMDDNCFVPMQTLNELRRGVSDQLVKEMTEPYRRKAAEKPEQKQKQLENRIRRAGQKENGADRICRDESPVECTARDSGDHDDLRRHGMLQTGNLRRAGGKRHPAGERTGKTGFI